VYVALVALAVVAAFIAIRFTTHAVRVEQLRARVNTLTADCAALNEHRRQLTRGRPDLSGPATDKLNADIDRCERQLEDADLAWGAEEGRRGWDVLW